LAVKLIGISLIIAGGGLDMTEEVSKNLRKE
jgi:hypothetical protein